MEAASFCRSLAPIELCRGEAPIMRRVGIVGFGFGAKGGEFMAVYGLRQIAHVLCHTVAKAGGNTSSLYMITKLPYNVCCHQSNFGVGSILMTGYRVATLKLC